MTSLALVFPGQGSQRVGMSHDFYETSEAARRVFDIASDVAEMDIPRLCFAEGQALDQTEYAQPAILTAEIAAYIAARGFLSGEPEYFGGHSLGEYAALVAADVMPFEVAVKVVTKRGRLMQKVVSKKGGAMVALIRSEIESTNYRALVEDCTAQVANFNSSEQVVIGGKQAAIDALSQRVSIEHPEMRVVPLAVSAPFHTSLMAEIEEEFEDFLGSFTSQMNSERASRVVSNVTGGFHSPDDLVGNLVRQVSAAVQWRMNMDALANTRAALIEIGPTRVLGKFFSNNGYTVKTISDLRSLSKYKQSVCA